MDTPTFPLVTITRARRLRGKTARESFQVEQVTPSRGVRPSNALGFRVYDLATGELLAIAPTREDAIANCRDPK